MSLLDDINNESKNYGGGARSDFFQFEKGLNRIRIMAKPKVIAFHFFGKGQKPDVCVGIEEGCPHHGGDKDKATIKLATYVIDRKDGRIKLAELPLSISYALNDLQQDPDYAFSEFPMPYDVKITHDPDNKDPKAKYRLVNSPVTGISKEEREQFEEEMKKMTPEQYVQKRKDKQTGNTGASTVPPTDPDLEKEFPDEDIDPDLIPF